MAKYIIDVPNSFVDITNGLHIPIDKEGDFRIDTGLKLTPYTEPNKDNAMWMDGYEKGVEAGRDDAWELIKDINYLEYDDFVACFSGMTEEQVFELSYQEAKSQYEAWKNQKDRIRVGDEVTLHNNVKLVVVTIDHGTSVQGIDENGECYEYIELDELTKTGRHFDDVEELLKKMKEE